VIFVFSFSFLTPWIYTTWKKNKKKIKKIIKKNNNNNVKKLIIINYTFSLKKTNQVA